MTFLALFLPVLLAITVHEMAHAQAAYLAGDDTAERAGRASLNPLRHVDMLGTLALPVMLYVATAGVLMFGYAKSVPVAYGRLAPAAGAAVALAGPASNFLQALVWAALPPSLTSSMGATANLVIGAFNLLPIPPLDGGRALMCLAPAAWARQLARVEPYGAFIAVAIALAIIFVDSSVN